MKETIEPKYVTFDTAKWLKGIGFDLEVRSYYRHDGIIFFWEFKSFIFLLTLACTGVSTYLCCDSDQKALMITK